MKLYPKKLPSMAQTFRVFIDDKYGNRILISEWMHFAKWSRFIEDFAPQFKNLKLGFIASSSPQPENKNYGDNKHYWHWKKVFWQGTMKQTPDFKEEDNATDKPKN